MAKSQHIRFVSKAPDDPVSVGDQYEEFLPSGATVLKEVVSVDGETYLGKLVRVIRVMPEGSVLHLALPVLPDSKRPTKPRRH